jgi:hypothetical protein
MANESAHQLTKHKSASAERRLALEVRSWKFGFAVLEGTNLLDWGVRRFPAGDSVAAIRRLVLVLTAYAPSIAIARRTRRAEHGSSAIAAQLLRTISGELHRRSIRFVVLARRDVRDFFVQQGRANKNAIAMTVADRFELLKSRIPRARRPWDPERSTVTVFDALATTIAFDGLQAAGDEA